LASAGVAASGCVACERGKQRAPRAPRQGRWRRLIFPWYFAVFVVRPVGGIAGSGPRSSDTGYFCRSRRNTEGSHVGPLPFPHSRRDSGVAIPRGLAQGGGIFSPTLWSGVNESHGLCFSGISRLLCVNISPGWIGSRRPLPVSRHWVWWRRFVRARWLLRLPDRDQRLAYALRGRWFRRQRHYRPSH
jgi:hypothetical protein